VRQIDSLFSQLFHELFYLMISMLLRSQGTEIEMYFLPLIGSVLAKHNTTSGIVSLEDRMEM